MISRRSFLSLVATAAAMQNLAARAQERFSPFVGSNPDIVERMIKLAAPQAGETVMDLGAGDGRIVFAATRNRSGVRGIGVEINADLVRKANAEAEKLLLADRVRFLHQNVFDADLSKVDVIFMWLFPELMRLLRPKILREARPGARLVAATWDMGNWWPADRNDEQTDSYIGLRLWVVPARVEGGWEWTLPLGGIVHHFNALFEQRMQLVEGVARLGRRREIIQDMTLRGDVLKGRLSITVPALGFTRFEFEGKVKGDHIDGRAEVQLAKTDDEEEKTVKMVLPWKARRTSAPGYFEHTGPSLD